MLNLLKSFWGTGTLRVRPRRPRRLAVIDAASIDTNRRVILVRRDNIEHLVLIGGSSDVVIESKIQRSAARMPMQPAWAKMSPPTMDFSERPASPEAARLPHGVTSRGSAPKLTPPGEPLPLHNLEEIKLQLEAALNSSPASQDQPPGTDPLAFPSQASPDPQPEGQPSEASAKTSN